jgi:hypothetical protein
VSDFLDSFRKHAIQLAPSQFRSIKFTESPLQSKDFALSVRVTTAIVRKGKENETGHVATRESTDYFKLACVSDHSSSGAAGAASGGGVAVPPAVELRRKEMLLSWQSNFW